MTLFESKPIDPVAEQRAKKRRNLMIEAVVVVLILAVVAYLNRFWPEEHIADKFFTSLEQKDYEKAYALWRADPQWQQHVERFKEYPFGQFQLDWGPTGDYGYITKHEVKGAVEPTSKDSVSSGVIVAVRVNDRAKPACLWIEKATKAISFSPTDCAAP